MLFSKKSNNNGSSYFGDENRGNNDQNGFYGSSSDAYDIRYADDSHQTYGKQYEEKEK